MRETAYVFVRTVRLWGKCMCVRACVRVCVWGGGGGRGRGAEIQAVPLMGQVREGEARLREKYRCVAEPSTSVLKNMYETRPEEEEEGEDEQYTGPEATVVGRFLTVYGPSKTGRFEPSL